MTVAAASVHAYRLPLTAPVRLGVRTHAERRGVLLRLEDTSGAVGWGDAAPLDGFSRETLAEAHAALAAAARTLAAGDAVGPLPPSARFALDTAVADLAGTLRPAAGSDTLALAGLIVDGDAPAQAARLAGLGYRAVKLKVGRGDVAADVARVRAVRAALPPEVALRLDANRAWTPAAARRFADGVAGVAIAFLEEPLADADGLEALTRDTGLPVALDESLADPGATVPPWAAAVVLKPTVLGGAVRRLADEAAQRGAPAVLSAAFESGIGMRAVAALALATGAQPAGLDPYRWLASDVLSPRLPLDRASVPAADLFAPRDVVLP